MEILKPKINEEIPAKKAEGTYDTSELLMAKSKVALAQEKVFFVQGEQTLSTSQLFDMELKIEILSEIIKTRKEITAAGGEELLQAKFDLANKKIELLDLKFERKDFFTYAAEKSNVESFSELVKAYEELTAAKTCST